MAKSAGLQQALYVGGRDISNDVSAIAVSCPRGVLEVPNLSQPAMERIYGLSDGGAELSGWFDDAANKIHDAFKGLPTGDIIALWALGSAQGNQAATLVGKQLNYDHSRESDGALSNSVQVQGSSGVALEWMEMFTSFLDTQASSGASASKDDLASTSSGLAAVLQVNDIDSGTPTVVLEDSANDSTWATLISFTAVADGSEPTAERKTVSGTVDRYLRVNVTGTFTNLDYALAYRRGETIDDVAYA